jgi:hypothetical protein
MTKTVHPEKFACPIEALQGLVIAGRAELLLCPNQNSKAPGHLGASQCLSYFTKSKI